MRSRMNKIKNPDISAMPNCYKAERERHCIVCRVFL